MTFFAFDYKYRYNLFITHNKESQMPYDNHSVYDFVMDESFKEWVKDPQSGEGIHWNEWISQNPDKKELIDEARQVILYMDFKTHYLSKRDINTLWLNLDRRIEEKRHPISITMPVRRDFNNYRSLAAVFIGLLLLSVSLFFVLQYNNTTEYITQYGETKTVLLPDSSTVTLNANSTIRYNSDWNGDEPREVWLKGEAFFSVVHTTNDQKFVVSTSDLDIEVLGTEFNVRNRTKGTEVVLNSGKVKLSLPASLTKGETDMKVKEVFMKPGELIEYSESKKSITRKEIDAEKYTAWQRENRFIFEDTPVSEIVRVLEDNYGFEVIMKDSTLARRKFTATYPTDNVEVLLNALSKSFNVKISQTEISIVFESNQ